ncbi:DUF2059 domain-containing protein [Sulfitobacter sp. G21635-S1]|uniref:DUF2059 domain-containing protein n=1 Tax=Sulfitobacter sp. G21635-S1 TaxID=3014043 RepID=UPI0022AEA541|nr:DUF2059 domain-containing protein [Sulfitobacter sp. G21635-S1]MCZ4257555.1 DUF2059 domain-containing protein [Sulfitobacter sp. G21635-S1]
MLAALRPSLIALTTTIALVLMAFAPPARAADAAKLREYLEITGFDVALESIRLSADNAPAMLGIEADAFGSEWSRLVNEVFATETMQEMAMDILGETLSDDLLTHAADFYASDLGQRLVAVENDSHMEEQDGLKTESGAAIMEGLRKIDSPRIALLERLTHATDAEGASLRAIQEVQVRFLMAAAGAGVIELQMDEADLREAMRSQEDEMRQSLAASALINAAYTYQAFSDAEVEAYAEALEDARMQKVYALMNAVQYEIMANRFEAVAARLPGMQPSTDL